MIFRRKAQEPKPGPTYSYEVFPENISDGTHEFDDVSVAFSKPGWQWVIYEHTPKHWTRIFDYGAGFPTRDAALVDLLKAAKNHGGQFEQPSEEDREE